ncbi:MAG: hypothetical protein IJS78_00830 [Clostridia bacterium]|nr:hypothetical protein [Clostridia bacterium]
MREDFKFTMWVYPPISQFTPDEVDLWADCGMTVPMAPKMFFEKDDPALLLPFLDRAEKRGIKLIAHFDDLGFDEIGRIGAEEYERRFRRVCDVIGSHPALYGFTVGDEPGTAEEYANSIECLKIQKKVAPHLKPFLNYSGSIVNHSKEQLHGKTPEEWIRYMKEETGVTDFVYDEYSQMINDHGRTIFFESMKKLVGGAEAAGCDCWVNLLSTEHLVFHAPNEVDVRWQIHMSAVCGCRGTVWFRFYDRDIAIDAINSPIDEFGNKTEQFYAIYRTQRRFLANYAQLPSMKRLSTYAKVKDRGVYPVFKPGDHEYIRDIDVLDETVFSFFEDEKGDEYLCLVNGDVDHYSVVRIDFDPDKCDIYNVTLNGTKEMKLNRGAEGQAPDLTLYPAQLVLIRIAKK